jgi:CMP-N,N'-diacetyllegionaminic acid synthase
VKVLGVIPARGGSKGIPGKNLRLVAGRPLLAYTADAARNSKRLDRVVLSTDDPSIAEAGQTLGLDVPFLRPRELAGDDTPMMPVLRHAFAEMTARGFAADAIVLLQPTSPLRRAEHVDSAIDLLERTGADSVVTVIEVPHQFSPASVVRLEGDKLFPYEQGPVVTRRQDKPRVYARNGPAVLALRPQVLERSSFYEGDCRGLIMDAAESVDVDTAWDLEMVEFLLARKAMPHG